MLVDLAMTLKVTSDELLGIKPLKEKASPKKARLLKRLEKVDELPPADKRAVLESSRAASVSPPGKLSQRI